MSNKRAAFAGRESGRNLLFLPDSPPTSYSESAAGQGRWTPADGVRRPRPQSWLRTPGGSPARPALWGVGVGRRPVYRPTAGPEGTLAAAAAPLLVARRLFTPPLDCIRVDPRTPVDDAPLPPDAAPPGACGAARPQLSLPVPVEGGLVLPRRVQRLVGVHGHRRPHTLV